MPDALGCTAEREVRQSIRPCDFNVAMSASIAALASASIIVPPEGLGTSGKARSDDLLAADDQAPRQAGCRRSSRSRTNAASNPRSCSRRSMPGTGATNRQPPAVQHRQRRRPCPAQAPVAPAPTIQHLPVAGVGRRRRPAARPRPRHEARRRSAASASLWKSSFCACPGRMKGKREARAGVGHDRSPFSRGRAWRAARRRRCRSATTAIRSGPRAVRRRRCAAV